MTSSRALSGTTSTPQRTALRGCSKSFRRQESSPRSRPSTTTRRRRPSLPGSTRTWSDGGLWAHTNTPLVFFSLFFRVGGRHEKIRHAVLYTKKQKRTRRPLSPPAGPTRRSEACSPTPAFGTGARATRAGPRSSACAPPRCEAAERSPAYVRRAARNSAPTPCPAPSRVPSRRGSTCTGVLPVEEHSRSDQGALGLPPRVSPALARPWGSGRARG
mmetsp:Transcript_1824/g.5657  ORF Transcript_1824/g.5657 Transcript_1824/m.5657 type:complete len:216 (-) Transcript_1824:110-757(-)